MIESELVIELKNRSQHAFSVLVKTYQNMVFNTVLGIVQQFEEAEDVAQEVFIQVYQSIDGFRGDSKLSTWIYRISITKSLDFVRSKKAKKRFSLITNIIGFGDKEPTTVAEFHHPGISLDKKEAAVVLFKAISKLPENQKTAFILIKTEGLNYDNVAQILNISVKAVEGLMHRAKENLRKSLGDYYGNKN